MPLSALSVQTDSTLTQGIWLANVKKKISLKKGYQIIFIINIHTYTQLVKPYAYCVTNTKPA
jgi:hypothetical protein